MTEPRKLLTLEFLGLCVVTFMAFCNFTVFYNLFSYLGTLGIPADLRGLVIGSYSLAAMMVYLLASPFLTPANAPRTMFSGMAVMAVCGFGYLFIHSFWGLLGLRMMSGLGQTLMAAGAMAFLVSIIPQDKSGQAYAVYSIAMLLPYGIVPAVMDALAAFVATPAQGYAGATVTLLPAAWVVWRISRRNREPLGMAEKKCLPRWADMRVNLAQLPVALLILLNIIYMTNWGSIFFLFKGFADLKGMGNVGSFFTVLMVVMIGFRLFAGRLFDAVDKARLITVTFVILALGHLALDHLPGNWAIPLVAAFFGVGMGMGQPILYGMMFDVSAPHFRSLNANLMLCAAQMGFILGPVLGGPLVTRWGYHGYFLAGIWLALTATLLSVLLVRRQRQESPDQ